MGAFTQKGLTVRYVYFRRISLGFLPLIGLNGSPLLVRVTLTLTITSRRQLGLIKTRS